jgi:hypothetical protein
MPADAFFSFACHTGSRCKIASQCHEEDMKEFLALLSIPCQLITLSKTPDEAHPRRLLVVAALTKHEKKNQ